MAKEGPLTVKIVCKLPWWWRPYLEIVAWFDWAGLIEADGEVIVKFIMRHAKIKVEPVK